MWIVAAAVLIAALAVGVAIFHKRNPLIKIPGIPGLRGLIHVSGAPDYALTGDYWPSYYWSTYWPAGGSLGRGSRILGNQIYQTNRGL